MRIVVLVVFALLSLPRPTNAQDAAWVKYGREAEAGNADAQFWLATSYLYGQTPDGEWVPKDCKKGIFWRTKAAEQGLAKSQSSLGFNYKTGTCVLEDYGEAVKWYRRAAMQGDDSGQFGLYSMYFSGNGVPKDMVEAYAGLILAASQGYEPFVESKREFAQYIRRYHSSVHITRAQKRARELQAQINARR